MMIQYILIMECLWLWHIPELIMECLWMWYVPQLVMEMVMAVVCSTVGYGNVYGCGMFHNWLWQCLWLWYVPQLVMKVIMAVVCSTVVMEWLQLLWNGYGRGMFHGCNDMVVVCSTRVG